MGKEFQPRTPSTGIFKNGGQINILTYLNLLILKKLLIFFLHFSDSCGLLIYKSGVEPDKHLPTNLSLLYSVGMNTYYMNLQLLSVSSKFNKLVMTCHFLV